MQSFSMQGHKRVHHVNFLQPCYRGLQHFSFPEYSENSGKCISITLSTHDGVVEQVQPRKLSQILNDMLEYAYQQGMLEEQTVTEKDLFDTKIMGELTPPPSVVRRQFFEKYNISPKTATDFYYQFSQATNYIRTDRIAKDEKWAADTEFSDFWTAYKKRTISHL